MGNRGNSNFINGSPSINSTAAELVSSFNETPHQANATRDKTASSFAAQSGGANKPSAQLPGTPKVDFNVVLDDKLPF